MRIKGDRCIGEVDGENGRATEGVAVSGWRKTNNAALVKLGYGLGYELGYLEMNVRCGGEGGDGDGD
jgi:hypothetical protein